MKRLLKFIMVMVVVGFISGCSELEEIEERGFVVGAAYDVVKKKKSNPIMKGTYQMVLPSKLAQQGGQGGGDSENYINVSAKADSVFEQIRIIAKKISRTLFFPHIQVIIFSAYTSDYFFGRITGESVCFTKYVRCIYSRS